MGADTPLRLRRLEKGWSQYHVAFSTGVPQVRISYAERGYPALTDKQKKILADFFKLPEKELFPVEDLKQCTVGQG